MSIKIIADDDSSFTKTTFPGGESCIRLTGSYTVPNLTIELDFESNVDLFDLALLVDAIERKYTRRPGIQLFMAYVPYARQDRVCNPGESLSVKVVADFINNLCFDAVCIIDPHSDVASALFNNVVVIEQSVCAERLARLVGETTVLVSPDAGANKKVFKFAQKGGFAEVIRADKVRDLATGNIIETKVYSENVGDKDFLIVDDICDGGRTFIELAKQLRKLTTGKISLFVTHGIFSAGTKVFDGIIDTVYTANSVGVTGNDAVDAGGVIRI
jgi:ribose-phosphate pyrophosphokinase